VQPHDWITGASRLAGLAGAQFAVTVMAAALPGVWVSGSSAAPCIDYRDYVHWAGSVDTPSRDVALSGTVAYVAAYHLGFRVIDITNPQSLEVMGSVQTPGRAYGVAVSGT